MNRTQSTDEMWYTTTQEKQLGKTLYRRQNNAGAMYCS